MAQLVGFSQDAWASNERSEWPAIDNSVRLTDAKSQGVKENVHLFDALDFLAELTQHIPPRRVQLIGRYGLYSSRTKDAGPRCRTWLLAPRTGGLAGLTSA